MTEPRLFTIGVDIDGVIADFVSVFRAEVLREYGVELADSDIRAHDLYLALGVSKDEAREMIRRTLDHQALALYPGAADGLAALVKSGLEVHIVTARNGGGAGAVSAAAEWLVQRRLHEGVHYHRVDVVPEGGKHTIASHMHAFVDDNLDEVIALAEHSSPDQLLIVFDHPWNQTIDVHSRFVRVGNWPELVDTVNAAAHPLSARGTPVTTA